MEIFALKSHLSCAIYIIRTNTIVLWGLALVALFSVVTFLLKDTRLFWPLNILSTILSIAATPVIYGIYYEVFEDTYSSVRKIAATYVLKYVWLLIRMYLPVVFLAGFPLLLSPESAGTGYFQVTIISFSLIYMYVIPSFYISGQQNGAITTGIRFLLKHLSPSTPLILAVLLLETSMLILQQNKPQLLELGPLVFASIDFALYLAASICDFALFLILISIMKHEDSTSVH